MPLPAPAETDRRRAREGALARLASEFTGTFNTETIDRLLLSSERELAATATVTSFVPLLAERFARQRLQALARNDGQELGQVRSVRDEIEQRVRRLLDDLGVPATS